MLSILCNNLALCMILCVLFIEKEKDTDLFKGGVRGALDKPRISTIFKIQNLKGERERERMSSSVSGNMKGFYKQKKNTNLTTTAKSSKSRKPPIHASTSPSLNSIPDLQGSISFLGFSHPQSPSSFLNFIYFIFLI